MNHQNKSKKILIIALAVVIILIILGVIFILFMKEDWPTKQNGNNNGNDADTPTPILKGTFEEKLKQCLDEDLKIETCYLAYDDSEEALPLCEKMGELKNKCFYKIAIINGYLDICVKIDDGQMQEECDEQIKGGKIFENE